MNRRIIASMLLLAILGCASPPKHTSPEVDLSIPAGWSEAAAIHFEETADTSRWWLSFDDSLLADLVEEALGHNFNLRAAAAQVDAAAAVARIAGADLWPQLSASFNASRRKQNLIGIPIPGTGGIITTRSTSMGVSLDTVWEVDLWGRIRNAQAARLADLQASWADLAAIRLSIAGQTVKAYLAVIEAKLQVELAKETVESYRLSADQVQSRYERGVQSSLDLRLALANLATARSLRELRAQQLDAAVRQLEILLGRYPSGKLLTREDLPAVAAGVPPLLPSELLIRRPDLLAAERRYAGAVRQKSSALRAFFPSIRLTASGGTLTQQLEDLTDGDFSVWSIAAGITQPLFQGGRLRANYSQSASLADQALASYASALLRAFGEVESALVAEQTLARREALTAEAVEQSEAARRLAELQYREGLVDYITVLETQRRALTSRSDLLTIERQRLDARVNLHLALGGGFELRDEWMRFLETHKRK